jgi:hypothetical protein
MPEAFTYWAIRGYYFQQRNLIKTPFNGIWRLPKIEGKELNQVRYTSSDGLRLTIHDTSHLQAALFKKRIPDINPFF